MKRSKSNIIFETPSIVAFDATTEITPFYQIADISARINSWEKVFTLRQWKGDPCSFTIMNSRLNNLDSMRELLYNETTIQPIKMSHSCINISKMDLFKIMLKGVIR